MGSDVHVLNLRGGVSRALVGGDHIYAGWPLKVESTSTQSL